MATELKEQIINTSLFLFEKHGFHGVSVNQIVKASGTSKGGFYHHFQSKDELLFVIHDYFISYVLTNAEKAIVSSTYPTDKLQKIIKSFVTVFDLYKAHISVFYQESTYLKPKYEETIKQKRQTYRDIIFAVIQEGIDLGEFRPEISVSIIGMSIIGMINWSYKWYKKDGEKSIEEIADMYVDFILQSLLTEKAKQNPEFQSYFLHNRLPTGT